MASFYEYQQLAYQYAVYKSRVYPFIAIGEECGELQAIAAKAIRKEGNIFNVDKERVGDELGDVLWNVAAIATEMGLDLDEIAAGNLAKLANRKREGKIVER